MDDLLQQGITAYKAGKRDEARKIFIAVVKQSPGSERAWGWLYDTSNNDQERIYCLKQILRINPRNEKADELLNKLLKPPLASTTPPTTSVPSSPKLIVSPDNTTKKSSKLSRIAIAVVASFAVVCCVIAVLIGNPSSPSSLPTNEAAIPVEKIIAMTFSAGGSQTAVSYPTPFSTLTLAPTSTINVTPTTLVIPIPPVETNISSAPIPALGNPLRFYFINVGQGDATLIQMPDGKTVLIDGGDTDTGIVSQLQGLGVQRIDLMIATHPHADHIGGLIQVLQSFPVAKVVTNGQPHTTSIYERFLDGIATAQAEYVEVKQGDVISLGGIDFKVLNPANNNDPDLNENSVVLQFTYYQTTFLMMGDSGVATEANLLSTGLPLKADILKVGHHGSTSGSTMAFLNAVQPKTALYSAGVNNQYGHPASQTISALTAVGATIYGTDQNGMINIKVDSTGYTINNAQEIVKANPVLPAVIVATLPPPSSGSSGFEIVSVTSPISKGANATLTAKTSPNASCTITVYYKSGPSQAAGLEPKTADGNGMVSWTWKVGSRTTSGTWRIVVICNGVTKETTHEVQ